MINETTKKTEQEKDNFHNRLTVTRNHGEKNVRMRKLDVLILARQNY